MNRRSSYFHNNIHLRFIRHAFFPLSFSFNRNCVSTLDSMSLYSMASVMISLSQLLIFLITHNWCVSRLKNVPISDELVDSSTFINKLNEMALHMTTRKEHVDIVKYLAENGVEVNAKTWLGKAILHVAAKPGHVDIVHEIFGRKWCTSKCNRWERRNIWQPRDNMLMS